MKADRSKLCRFVHKLKIWGWGYVAMLVVIAVMLLADLLEEHPLLQGNVARLLRT